MRLHLFEFEDMAWFPQRFREYLTDYLRYEGEHSVSVPEEIVDHLLAGLMNTRTKTIVDLASGSGGRWVDLINKLNERLDGVVVILTDYFPNIRSFTQLGIEDLNIRFLPDPVDARAVPPSLQGFRTQFLSFHHFRPDEALAILQNAVDSENGILIYEEQERSLRSILVEIYACVKLFFVTPQIRPLTLGRLFFTYCFPLLPLALLWDGVVSCLRTYSVHEMQEMITKVEGSQAYTWRVGRIKVGMRAVIYLTGWKRGGITF